MPVDEFIHPFPGLRPFEPEEHDLFFGREGQSEEILRRLREHRFVAVVGASGSGKSSLIRAGLLPYLDGGFLAEAGAHWRIAIFRPGGDPIKNLATALNDQAVLGGSADGADGATQGAFLLEVSLRRSALGLVEAVRLARLPQDDNVLIVVDQFEELFRFAGATDRPGRDEDAAAFVKLLQEASQQRELPIYVVLTMRSDYIGDCARYSGLPEAVTNALFLIPRMARDQRRAAIAEPVRVGGGSIAPRLVVRLLNDVGDDPDQLPILQHALMRTWDHWKACHDYERPIDLDDYLAIGGMADALSQHADESYDGLPDDRYRSIAKRIFQALSEKGPDNRETRRPTTVNELAQIADVPIIDIIQVVEDFRAPGRSFLMPPRGTALEATSVVDISHESLIRGWRRMRQWVDEEAESARVYRRLADTVSLHAQATAGLLRDPDLEHVLAWRDRERPNAFWGHRYHPGFEQAMEFLEESQLAREAEQRQRQSTRRRMQLATSAVTAVIAIVAVVALWEWRNAKFERDHAQQESEHARQALSDAERERNAAQQTRNQALLQQSQYLTQEAQQQAVEQGDDIQAVLLALEALPDANSSDDIVRNRPLWAPAEEALKSILPKLPKPVLLDGSEGTVRVVFSPDASRIFATTLEGIGIWDVGTTKRIAFLPFRTSNGWNLAISANGQRLVAGLIDGSVQIWERQSATDHGGDEWQSVAVLKGHAFSMVGDFVAINASGTRIVSGASDGTVRIWEPLNISTDGQHTSDWRQTAVLTDLAYVASVAITADGKRVGAGSFIGGQVLIWEIQTDQHGADENWKLTATLQGHEAEVFGLAFSPDGTRLFSGANGEVWLRELARDASSQWGVVTIMKGFAFAGTLGLSPDGSNIISGDNDGTVRVWNAKTGAKIHAFRNSDWSIVAASEAPDHHRIAAAQDGGAIYVWEFPTSFEASKLAGQELREYAKNTVPRCLTLEERNFFSLSSSPPEWCGALHKWPDFREEFLSRGQSYVNKKDYDRAIADYTHAIQLDPKYVEAYNNRGAAYKAQGNIDRAIADYTQAIQLDPKYAAAYNNRGRAYEAKKDYDSAIADYSAAGDIYKAKSDIDSAKANYNAAGDAYKARGDLDNAIADYTQAIQLDPKYAAAYNNRGDSYKSKGNIDAAVADYSAAGDFTKVIQIDPKNAHAYNSRGRVYAAEYELRSAIADYTQAIQIDPKYAAAYNNRGRAYEERENYDGAIADFTEVIRLDPKYAAAYSGRGDAYKSKGDLDHAIADFTEVIRLDPKNAHAYDVRGHAYEAKKDYDGAIGDFTEVILLDPKNSDAYNSRGRAYKEKDDHDRAIADFTEAIQLDPQNADAYNNRGDAYNAKGDIDRAIADCSRAILVDPKYAAAYNTCGDAYKAKGALDRAVADYNAAGDAYGVNADRDRAIADFTKVIRLDQKNAHAYSGRGHEYERKHDHDGAIADYTQAIQLGEKNAHTYNERGDAYEANKDYDRAIADFTEVIQLDPEKADAYNHRGHVYVHKKNYDGAIGDFTEMIRLDPKNMEAYDSRGSAYKAKGDIDRAIADFTEVIRLDPKFAYGYLTRGQAYEANKDYDRATADFTEVIQLEPNEVIGFNARCRDRALANRDLREALVDCNESLRLQPEALNTLNSRGLVHLKLGAYDRAIADYSAAIAKDEKDADSLYGRGVAKLKSGDASGGNADIAAAKAIKPDIAEVYAGYGVT